MIFIFFRKTIFSLSNNTQPFFYDLPPFWHPPPLLYAHFLEVLSPHAYQSGQGEESMR